MTMDFNVKVEAPMNVPNETTKRLDAATEQMNAALRDAEAKLQARSYAVQAEVKIEPLEGVFAAEPHETRLGFGKLAAGERRVLYIRRMDDPDRMESLMRSQRLYRVAACWMLPALMRALEASTVDHALQVAEAAIRAAEFSKRLDDSSYKGQPIIGKPIVRSTG